MPLQTPEEMENTPIPKLGSITWTKCSERMPPDKPGNPVIAKPGDGSVEKVSSRWLLNVLLPKLGKDKLEWTEFTPEKWKDLNK